MKGREVYVGEGAKERQDNGMSVGTVVRKRMQPCSQKGCTSTYWELTRQKRAVKKAPEGLVSSKLNISQQCAHGVKVTSSILGCRGSVASRSRKNPSHLLSTAEASPEVLCSVLDSLA